MWPKIKRLLVLGLELGFLYKRVRGQWKVDFLTGLGGKLRVTLLSATTGHLASRTLQLKFYDLLIEEETLSYSENKWSQENPELIQH